MNILLVEDDQSFGYILKAYLDMYQYSVKWVKDGAKALKMIHQFPFDLCILDIMLPNIDGFTIAEKIIQNQANLPFIFLTAKSLKVDKLKGYRLGCDDYITKPIDEELLIAKIQAILKRTQSKKGFSQKETLITIGDYQFDPNNLQLKRKQHKRQLTEKEAQLLKMLCDHSNRLLTRNLALKELWGKNDLFNRKTMDVFIFKLRKYLQDDPKVRITNVHGKGFILEINPAK